MLCVHLGPGRLGLGLVLDALLSLDLDVCLIGASDRSHEEVVEYEIAFIGEAGGPQARRVTWACNPAVVTDLHQPVLDRLRSDESVLITSSLADQATEREGLLRDILEQRPARGAETVVLACENDPDPMYAAVSDDYPRVHYCACVVDRVVNWNDPWHHADGRRRVVAHPLGRWVIWHPKPDESEVITTLRGAPHVVLVENEDLLAGNRKRRQWAVTGVHLVMALITRLLGADALPPEDQRFEDLQERVRPLMAIVLEAIAREHPELPHDNEFVAERMRVFRETPDSAVRILENRLVRADLRGLMRHVDRCIGEAAREAHRVGISCEQFEGVIDLLLATLEHRLAYFDEPDSANLDPYVDALVVRLFQEVVDGWMDPTRALRASERLVRLLSIHRST